MASCKKDNIHYIDEENMSSEQIIVTNRGGHSISFIDANNPEFVQTLSLPGSEPMYPVYVPATDKIYVGDRAQNLVYVINPETKQVEKTIPVGKGVFHMWAGGTGKQLWVTNDVDKTVSVIDLATGTAVHTFATGLKPHDVFVSGDGTKAYVSVFANDINTPDSVFMYTTNSFEKTGAVAADKEPHLFHQSGTDKLFVACQSGTLYSLNGSSLSEISHVAMAGAHGIYISPTLPKLYVTDITGSKLYTVGTENGDIKNTMNLNPGTAHNIVVTSAGNKMFVTHSGPASTSVTAYNIDPISGIPTMMVSTINTAPNPFGITTMKR